MLSIDVTECVHKTQWSESYYFPCCPKEIGTNAIKAYFQNLKAGTVLAYNDDSPKVLVVEFLMIENNTSILVMCEREGFTCEIEGFQPWLVVNIIFREGIFIHSKLGSYFDKDDAIIKYIESSGKFEDSVATIENTCKNEREAGKLI